MPLTRIMVVGASSGGVEALCSLFGALPAGFNLPVLVTLHIGRRHSVLPKIFNRCGPLKAVHPVDREVIRPGHVYVAPPNHHLLVQNSRIALSRGPRENSSRPAIDPLFRSAARSFRSGVIGVLLTGELDDGVAGLFAIKSRGGLVIVQDPEEASSSSMPRRAIESVEVDHILRLAQISKLVTKLSLEKPMAHKRNDTPSRSSRRHKVFGKGRISAHDTPAPLSCPDCQGPLFEAKTGKMVNFHCIVGHTYSPMSLSDAHVEALERALWVAIRTLKERLTVHQFLLQKHTNSQEHDLAQRMGENMERINRDIELLEQIQSRI